MKALIYNNKVVDISENEFPVSNEMTWVDCDNTVEKGFSYDGTNFTSNKPTAEQLQQVQATRDVKKLAKASANQKLLDLGLTQAEATALTGYTPPVAE
jgi:hypothetical protein